MTNIESHSERPQRPVPTKKDVAIVGAGIAGLTCALRLSERGYQVTLYEKEPVLGGDLSSEFANGMFHDVYPHLFCDWYVNFWQIVENDLKIRRQDAFEPRMSVKLLDDPSRRWSPATHTPDGANAAAKSTAKPSAHPRAETADAAPHYLDLKNASSLKSICEDLFSGALPPPDMFLVGFTLLDLASQRFHRSNILQQQTVNGFLYSRPYATEDCADLHNMILMEIWSIPSSDTSADAYKDFVRCALGSRAEPFAWLLRGSLEETLIKPWRDKLGACAIKPSVAVTAIELGDHHEVRLTLDDKTEVTHANVVLAVPAPELAKLVMTGSPGRRVVDRVPALSELQRSLTASILVVTLYFKVKLPNIPREHVGLAGSLGFLTFVDISQLWTSLREIKEQHTVLILAASDAYAFTSDNSEEWAHVMIRELARYLPAVRPGAGWGAADSNIDYSKSRPQSNKSHTLFLNDVSSEQWQPEPSYRDLENVFFAGDFCLNEVKMATIEAAVLSGLHAARAVQTRTERTSDIEVLPHVTQHSHELALLKLALLPVAYGAKAWSTVNGALRDLSRGQKEEGIVGSLATLSLIPLHYAADWVGTLEAFAVGLCSAADEPHISRSMVPDLLRAAARRLVSATDHVRDFASERSHREDDELRDLAARLADFFKTTDSGASEPSTPRSEQTALFDLLRSALGSETRHGSRRYQSRSEYVRRHRAKR